MEKICLFIFLCFLVLPPVTCQICQDFSDNRVCLPFENNNAEMEIENLDNITFQKCSVNDIVTFTIVEYVTGAQFCSEHPPLQNCGNLHIYLQDILNKNCTVIRNKLHCKGNQLELNLTNQANCIGNWLLLRYSYRCCRNTPGGGVVETGEQSSTGLSDVGKVGLAIAMGVLGAIIILLIVCCYALKERKRKPVAEKQGQQPAMKSIASEENYGLPSHIHYVPYDALGPRTSGDGEYTEIDNSKMNGQNGYSQDVTDLYAKPNKVKTTSKDKLIENSVYESTGNVSANAHDNSYLEITDEDNLNRKPSVQKMVNNDIYNK